MQNEYWVKQRMPEKEVFCTQIKGSLAQFFLSKTNYYKHEFYLSKVNGEIFMVEWAESELQICSNGKLMWHNWSADHVDFVDWSEISSTSTSLSVIDFVVGYSF